MKSVEINQMGFKAHYVSYIDSALVLVVATFPTAQIMDFVIANFNSKDVRSVYVGGSRKMLYSGDYKAITMNTPDRNTGDGYHAIIYNTDSSIYYYTKEDYEAKAFDFLKTNSKVGILEEWTNYFMGALETKDRLVYSKDEYFGESSERESFCEIRSFRKIVDRLAPYEDIISKIKESALRTKLVKIPVESNVSIPKDKEYIDIVADLILPHIQEKDTMYKEGDKISPILKTPIILEDGKIGALFHKQQEIAQAIFNAMAAGEKNVYLNGGAGLGKTYSSLKLAYMVCMYLITKGDPKFRIGIIVEAHIRDKWVEYVNGALRPYGIEPIILSCNRKSDIDKLSRKPIGPEILMIEKDKSKAKWHWKYRDINTAYAKEERIKAILKRESNTISKATNNVVYFDASTCKVNELKYIATLIRKSTGFNGVVYKSIKSDDGEIKGYYVATNSKTLIGAIKSFKKKDKWGINKAYHMKVKSLAKIKSLISSLSAEMYNESKITESVSIPNMKRFPLVCDCGSPLRIKIAKGATEEIENIKYIRKKRGAVTSASKDGCHYIKSDGTPLSRYEIDLVKRKAISLVVASRDDKFMNRPYRDEKGRCLSAKDIQRFKSGDRAVLTDFNVKVFVKRCTCLQASSENIKPYTLGKKVKVRKGADDVVAGTYYKNKLGRSIDFLIVDECHYYNGAGSNQTRNYLEFTRASKYVLPMSGSLTDGKSSNVFVSFFNFDTEYMKSQGYRYNSQAMFTKDYGRETVVTKYYPRGNQVIASTKQGSESEVHSKSPTEVAGLSPKVFANYLYHRGVSRTIEDMDIPLPERKYFKHEIDTPQEILDESNTILSELKSYARKERVNTSSAAVHALLSYPDNPDAIPIVYKADKKTGLGPIMHTTKNNITNEYLPKEKKLIETLNREINVENRRVLLFANYNDKKSVMARILYVLEKEGFNCASMPKGIPADTKAKWIKECYETGIDIILTNPVRVATGLDIIEYPTVYFYEVGFDSKVIRQAEARPYRPSQKQEVRIYYSYYKGTLQEEVVKLVAKKKNAAQAYEGIANKDILATMGGAESTEGLADLIDAIEGKKEISREELDNFNFAKEEDIVTTKKVIYSLDKPFTIDEVDLAM